LAHGLRDERQRENTMARIERIMFPTDFSEASSAAIPWVVRMGRMTGAQIFVVHVLREDPEAGPDPNYHYLVPEYARHLEADAKAKLHQVADCLPKDLKVETVLSHGDVTDQILKMVKSHQIDLIVMATRGESGWLSLLFGSVAEKVIKLADCPVLSIRKPFPKEDEASDTPPTAA